MRIDILTVFPEMFAGPMDTSILGRAKDKGILDIRLHNIRDYSESKHKNTDDYPFGGGAGMVMMAQPIFSCLEDVDPDHEALRIAMAPRGKTLSVPVARELAAKDRLLFLCGHYEGIDERAMEQMDMELSIGDYVLTGGELPAMVIIDCVSRFIPGVLGSAESAGRILLGRASRIPPVYPTRGVQGHGGTRGAAKRQPCADSQMAAGAQHRGYI